MNTAAAVFLCALLGCTAPGADASRSTRGAPSGPPSAVASAASPPSDGSAGAELAIASIGAPSSSASPAPSSSSSLELAASGSRAPEDPPWPPGIDVVTLSWIVHPEYGAQQPYRRHIDLTVGARGVTRILSVDVGGGILQMDVQAACNDAISLPPRAVAELTLLGTDVTMLHVDRPAPDRLELIHEVGPEGRCEDAAGNGVDCPTTRKLVGAITIPPNVKTRERFVQVMAADPEHGPFPGPPRERLLTCEGLVPDPPR